MTGPPNRVACTRSTAGNYNRTTDYQSDCYSWVVSEPIPESLQHRLSYLLGSLYRRAIEIETAALAPLGIGVKQQAALAVLADEGPMTQQELGLRLGIDRTTIVAVVDDLQGAVLIERNRDPADRRAYLIAPTRSGKAAHRRGERLVRDAQHALLDTLDEQERRTLIELLARSLPPRA